MLHSRAISLAPSTLLKNSRYLVHSDCRMADVCDTWSMGHRGRDTGCEDRSTLSQLVFTDGYSEDEALSRAMRESQV